MAETVVINIEANTQGLQSTIDLLTKLGQVEKSTAEEFKRVNDQNTASIKNAAAATAKEFDKVQAAIKNVKGDNSLAKSLDVSKEVAAFGNGMKSLKSQLKEAGSAQEAEGMASKFVEASSQAAGDVLQQVGWRKHFPLRLDAPNLHALRQYLHALRRGVHQDFTTLVSRDDRRRVDAQRRERHLAASPLLEPYGLEAEFVPVPRERHLDVAHHEHDVVEAAGPHRSPPARARPRWARTFARLPQVPMSHQTRAPLRVVSRNTRPQRSPRQVRTRDHTPVQMLIERRSPRASRW